MAEPVEVLASAAKGCRMRVDPTLSQIFIPGGKCWDSPRLFGSGSVVLLAVGQGRRPGKGGVPS